MQQRFVKQHTTTVRTRLMSISSGLLLGLLMVILYIKLIYYPSDYNQFNTIIYSFALLYFVAPIPLSFYIARQTGNSTQGLQAGGMLGCIGMLFVILSTVVYTFIFPGSYSRSLSDFVFIIMMILILLHTMGALLSWIGAVIGSALGKMSRRIVN
ncbi:MAG: hypothetical protein ACRDHZ_23800 [Ktedonobacteraceae bacterium]